jgi:hypothetical protein
LIICLALRIKWVKKRLKSEIDFFIWISISESV